MTMEDAAASALLPGGPEDQDRAQRQPHVRIDWRTGRPMYKHDAAFWKDHAARRIEQGLSVAAYCEANGLAKSTFQRHATLKGARSQGAQRASSPAPSRFVPVGAAAATAEPVTVEIDTGEGMKLRLAGAAADRLLQRVLARLA